MPSPLNQPHEPFMEAGDHWELPKLLLDIATSSGKALSNVPQRLLRGALLGKTQQEIAETCCYSSGTVRQYLSKEIYPAIKILLDLSDQDRLTSTKIPFVLQSYRVEGKRLPSEHRKTDLEKSKLSEEMSAEDLLTAKPVFENVEDLETYVEEFFALCEEEEYVQAFYTIFDSDTHDNSIYSYLDSAG